MHTTRLLTVSQHALCCGCLPGECLTWGGVCLRGYLPRVGICRGVGWPGGMSVQGGVYPSMQWSRHPLWTDTHLWKHNLRKLHLHAVTMQMCCWIVDWNYLTLKLTCAVDYIMKCYWSQEIILWIYWRLRINCIGFCFIFRFMWYLHNDTSGNRQSVIRQSNYKLISFLCHVRVNWIQNVTAGMVTCYPCLLLIGSC